MGNLCGKVANVEPSSGYRLGSSPQRPTPGKPTSSVPIPKSKVNVTGTGKPLGGISSPDSNSANFTSLSPREAAARAAEMRENEAKAKANRGHLAAKLEAQKRMTNHHLYQDSGKDTANDALVWD